MWKTILRRVLLMIPQLFILSLLIFILAKLMPGDALSGRIDPSVDAETIEKIRIQMGYYDAWYIQYFRWLKNALHGDLGIINPEDIVLAISNSGESDEILAIMPAIKNIGAFVIGMTGNINSRLAKASDLYINTHVDEEGCPLNLAPMSSTTNALVMGDAIAGCLMKLRNFSPQNFAMYHPGGSLGRKLLTKVGNLMKTGEALALCKADTSMEDIVILMSEKKLGVVCVMNDDNSLLVGIITEGDIRRALSHKEKFFSLKASDIMTTNYTKVDKEEMATQALSIMEDRPHQINVLPVFDDNNFVGVIRIHDLLKVR